MEGSFFAHGMSKKIFYAVHPGVVTELLQTSKTIMAVNPEDDDQIFGYITFCPDYEHGRIVVHFVFVKSTFRRMGVANALKQTMLDVEPHLDNPLLVSTHSTERQGSKNFLADKWQMIYNPYLLWRSIYDGTRPVTHP